MMPQAERSDVGALYSEWRPQILRWLRRMGCPESDLDDVVHDVFLIVGRRLSDFEGGNLAGWLYTITHKCLSSHRRKTGLRHYFTREHEVRLDEVDDAQPGPEALLERKQALELGARVLPRMTRKRREVFIRHVIEEQKGKDIAAALNIPLRTVQTRIFHARREFDRIAAEIHREGARPVRTLWPLSIWPFSLLGARLFTRARPAPDSAAGATAAKTPGSLFAGGLVVAAVAVAVTVAVVAWRRAAPLAGNTDHPVVAETPHPVIAVEPAPAARTPAPAPVPSMVEQTTAVPTAPGKLPSPASTARKSHGGGASPLDIEVGLIAGAETALRADRDPEKAGVLLDDYMTNHPDGAQFEQALALAIEAALKRRDPSGAELVARYLQRYPSGRYLPPVRRAAPFFDRLSRR